MLQMFLGEKNPNFQGCRSARLYLQGATTQTGPFSRPYVLRNSLPKPPFTEQKDKSGPSSAMHFNICLTLYTVAATNSDV